MTALAAALLAATTATGVSSVYPSLPDRQAGGRRAETTMASIPEMIVAAAQRHGVDPRLAVEVAQEESRLNPGAVSPAGAIGVMQLMPATAAELGVDPWDVAQNIEGGVRYLGQQLRRFGDTAQALAAYNWGPASVAAAVAEAGAGWLSRAPTETRGYVQNILSRLGQWLPSVSVPTTMTETRQAAAQLSTMDRTQQALVLAAALLAGLLIVLEITEE